MNDTPTLTDTSFADLLRIIGKGPNMSRPLNQNEARMAARHIFSGNAHPMQTGAFLLLLRYRAEMAEEIAGLVEGAQEVFEGDASNVAPDLDWPTYADRHKQQPWYILSALLLAENGTRVLMHGVEGAHDGYAPNGPVFENLGIRPAGSFADAGQKITESGFAYLDIKSFCPVVDELLDVRDTLGVRTVINTLARALNPMNAPCQVIGVAHPPYMPAHSDVARLLGQPKSVIMKGGGGEAQRNPLKPCRVSTVYDGIIAEETWPALMPETGVNWRKEALDVNRVPALWRGELDAPESEAAVIATAALALKLVGKADNFADADQQATKMWAERNKDRFSS
jgi:anthranilate phosphoribosyltransferase